MNTNDTGGYGMERFAKGFGVVLLLCAVVYLLARTMRREPATPVGGQSALSTDVTEGGAPVKTLESRPHVGSLPPIKLLQEKKPAKIGADVPPPAPRKAQ